MILELIDHKDNLLETLESESNPFKKGESLNISVKNNFPDFWDKEPYTAEFVVHKIEHFIGIEYPKKITDEVKEKITVSVALHEILYPGTKVLIDDKVKMIQSTEIFNKELHYHIEIEDKGDEGLWHLTEIEKVLR